MSGNGFEVMLTPKAFIARCGSQPCNQFTRACHQTPEDNREQANWTPKFDSRSSRSLKQSEYPQKAQKRYDSSLLSLNIQRATGNSTHKIAIQIYVVQNCTPVHKLPSTTTFVPLTKLALSLARNTTTSATSLALPILPIGFFAS